MRADEGTIQIRSYRVCFQVERRIHKIDRWRIPLPYGVPLAGLGWLLVALLAMIIICRLPVIGGVLSAVHPALRYVIVPVAAAWALTRCRIDGRAAHAAGVAWLRWRWGPQRLVAFRPAPSEEPVTLGTVTFVGDERGAALRPAVVRGPAEIVLRYPAALRERGRTLQIRPEEGPPLYRGKLIRLRRGQRVVIAR